MSRITLTPKANGCPSSPSRDTDPEMEAAQLEDSWACIFALWLLSIIVWLDDAWRWITRRRQKEE